MKKYLILASCMFIMLYSANAQYLWDVDVMYNIKSQLHSLAYHNAYKKLILQAEDKLSKSDYSVTYKQYTPPSGDKHDYVSLSRYWWADPSKSDGLPYINRDGKSNPELNQYDRNRLGEMCESVQVLSLAYFYSNDERYSAKAMQLIRTWFINKDTRMNPNLNYSQIIPGRNHSQGSPVGVIDTYSFVMLISSIELLKNSPNYNRKDRKELQAWFSSFSKWLISNENGKKEQAAKNNHGTGFDSQLVTYYLFTGNTREAKKIINSFADNRVLTQIEPDGKQPHELRRTLAYHYSNYNLEFMTDFLISARLSGNNIYKNNSVLKQRYLKAFDFLSQYLGKDIEEWKPYLQISGWEDKQQDLCDNIYRVIQMLDGSQTELLNTYQRFARRDLSDRNRLLYGANNPIEEVFEFIQGQLDGTLISTETVIRNSKENKKKYNPRSINNDGSLRLVSPRDWCSGFFPGSLWQVYQYTKAEKWKEQAEKYSWNIVDEQFDKTSHDVGFKMYCSFGHAYQLTNKSEYRDILIQSAKTLSGRFNPTVGLIRSWDWNSNVWKYPVIIDNMMNLELLFEATNFTGDSSFYKIAENHASVTMKYHFRNDYSSYHLVDFDPETGNPIRKQTVQGFDNMSAWARGQAWGLYGFVMAYRYTRNPAFLKQAEEIANFIFSNKNLPQDFIPYWDFNDTKIPNVPRDASAAAIIASALYELQNYSEGFGEKYISWADKILSSLTYHYRAPMGTNYGFLLLHSTGNLPSQDEIDVPICYADYYFIEALLRRNAIEGSQK